MSIDGFEPLNEEERVLAAQLGLGRRTAAPSAGVDEAIRAVAQKASGGAATHKPAANGWWKVGGVAAVCVLAVGLAWKTLHAPSASDLETLQTPAPVSESTAVPAPAADVPAEAAATPVEAAEADPATGKSRAESGTVRAATETAQPPAPPAPRVMAEMPATAKPAQADTMDPATAANSEASGARLKQRALSPPPPPEAVNAAQRANDAAVDTAAPASAPVQVTSSPARATVQADPEPAAEARAAATRSAAGALENGYDPRPPKTTEAEDVQLAWLNRIRTLYQTGKKEEAAASLEAWRKRYPDAPVPADLAPLGKVTSEK